MSTPKRAIVLRELPPLVPPAHGTVPGVSGGSRTKESNIVERRRAPELEKVAELRSVLLVRADAEEAGEAGEAVKLPKLVEPLCCLLGAVLGAVLGASEPWADEPERSYGWVSLGIRVHADCSKSCSESRSDSSR